MTEKKEEIKSLLDAAFQLISEVLVSRDGVDLMAAAKDYMRKAYKLLDELEEADNGG